MALAAKRLQQLHMVLKKTIQPFSTIDTSSPVIQVTPSVSSFDEKIHIKVQGLPSNATVTLHACAEQEWQKQPARFVSCGHYVSSGIGEVDVSKDPSFGGTYTGPEPMGLFWSMVPSPAGNKGIRFLAKSVEVPVQYKLSVFLGHLPVEDLSTGQIARQHRPVTTVTVDRLLLQPSVRRIPVKEGSIRGTLFLPPGNGPFPGIIDMFGLAGGLMETRSALLASKGFASLALPFYRFDDLPHNFMDVKFEYFQEAVKWLASHPLVQHGGIGVIAISGGAAVGLMMAWKCPEVKAFVRISSAGFHGLENLTTMGDLFQKAVRLNLEKCPDYGEGLVFRDGWTLTDNHIVPLWEKNVHILTLVGADDGQLSPEMGGMFYQLYPENRRHLAQLVTYEGGGHILDPPYTPLCRSCYNPFFDHILFWGGYPKEHATAQEDSWQRIQKFFHQHLG